MTEQCTQDKRSTNHLFPRWFTIWFIIACLVLLGGGIADEISGNASDGFNAWGASISIFLMYLLVLLVWKNRASLQTTISRLYVSTLAKAVFIGCLFAEVDELVCFPFNSLFPGATLVQDIVLTTPMYVFGHLFWFWVLRRYKFSVREAFYVGGISFWIVEATFGGAGAMIIFGFALWPFMVMLHGCHMVMPRLLLSSHFTALEQKETRRKYLFGVLAPIVGTGIGIIVACLIGPLLFDLK